MLLEVLRVTWSTPCGVVD